jgi:16S rRNA (cytosine1402-N4)-methyltransferase
MKYLEMSERETFYHTPVLLRESIEGLHIRPWGVYVDLTFGGGGHSRGILEALGKNGKLYGFDQDADAEANIPSDERFVFVRGNFRFLFNFLRYHGVEQVDGILADLGVSSHHFDDERRGFSFRYDGELDMRMNNRAGQTAADVVNTYSEEQLADVFYTYGELRSSRTLAARIVEAREKAPLHTIRDLLAVVKPFAGREKEKKFYAQLFQSLRIEVNDELQSLREMLEQALSALKTGGRLAVITYHSLEDRLVKSFIRSGRFDGMSQQDFYGNRFTPFRIINSKAITPSEAEIAQNPRARSAKLRIAEKTGIV